MHCPRFLPLFLLLLAPAFWLQTRGGEIQYFDRAHHAWHSTGVPAASLPNAADRALLASGVPVEGRAALTEKLEDFCS